MKPVTGRDFWLRVGQAIGIPGNCQGFTITCNDPGELVEIAIHSPLRLEDDLILKTTVFNLTPVGKDEDADHQ